MVEEIKKIIKRDGRIVDFDKEKIANAIFKAAKAVGGRDRELASRLADQVVSLLKERLKPGEIPTVEQVQDLVEKVLVENGHYRTAKAYILYRKERTLIREEKKRILQKDFIDDIDKKFSLNAIQILASRYLQKNEEGKIIESPKQLFERVAALIVIPDILYDEKVFDKNGKQEVHPKEEFNPEEYERKLGIGDVKWNKWHLERMKYLYDELNSQGKMKVSWSEFLKMVEDKHFEKYYQNYLDYFNLMVEKKFLPNSPTLFNAGTRLNQLSACFLGSQPIITLDGVKEIENVKVNDFVLTHENRFRKVKQIFRRNYSGFIYRVDVEKLIQPTLLATPEHPIYAIKKENLICKRSSNFLCKGTAFKRCSAKELQYAENWNNQLLDIAQWIPLSELREGDFVEVAFPKEVLDKQVIDLMEYIPRGRYVEIDGKNYRAYPIKRFVEIDEEFMLLAGYYLSEGCSDGRCLRFTFSSNELDVAKEVIKILSKKFGIKANSIELALTRSWLSIKVHSKILATFFLKLFGKSFSSKKIPSWILFLPPSKQKYLLIGLFRGDGTLIVNKGSVQARLVSENKDLIYKSFLMFLRLGIVPKIGKATKLSHSSPFHLTISSDGLEFINETFKVEFEKKRTHFNYIKIGEKIFLRVKRIEKQPFLGTVYNLEVEEDSSYAANFVGVHNCFVLNIDDNMPSIMEAAKDAALIFQSGGGIGINFSKIRPEGDVVSSTGGIASGPISFARIIDVITDVVKQGGKRRGACMGILEISHPDIEKFIAVKETPGMLENFNLSVLIFPDFIEAYYKDENYPLINPRDKKVWKYVKAKYLMDSIAMSAWRTGDPGVIFFDNLNKRNVLVKAKGPIRATNPCVTGDTYVVTDYGLVEAKELKEGMRVLTLDGWCEIEKVIDNGVKPILKIELQNGIEIKVTEDHELLTENGWKQAKELKKGEKLKIVMDYPQFSKANFDYPEETAEFLGFWCGISNSFYNVALLPEKDLEFEEYLREISSLISENSRFIHDGGQFKLNVNPKDFAEFIGRFDLKLSSSEKKLVPKLILQAPKNFQKAFLRGIFSLNGRVYNSKGSVAIFLSFSSKKFLQQIQLILLGFGIPSTLIKERRRNIKGETHAIKGAWRLLIDGWGAKKFVEEIGFRGEKLEKFLKLVSGEKFYIAQNNSEFVPIKSISKCGKERVFDVKAPPAFCWITNGLYSKDCGEEPLYEYESCNLGSINLYAHFKEDENGNKVFDWDDLKRTIDIATQFLDNVIDVNKFPFEKIEKTTKASRKIGLGIMGLADALFAMKIPYNSEEGFEMMRKIMEFVTFNAMLKSCKLAEKRGVFPLYSQSSYPNDLPIEGFYQKEIWTQDWNRVVEEIRKNGIRNAEVTTLAPTGSLSMLCDVSSGIEPQYALVFEKVVTIGSFYYTDLEFENQLRLAGLYEDEILKKIKENGGSVQGLKEIPEEIRKVFVTALDIPWWDHVRAQAEIGKWVCAATSKTINMPNWVVPEDVKNAFLFAYKLGCKGITIYRDGSKPKQVLYSPPAEVRNRQKEVMKLIKNRTLEIMEKVGIKVPEFWNYEEEGPKKSVKLLKKDVCPECGSPRLVEESGCIKCLDCGWSYCIVG